MKHSISSAAARINSSFTILVYGSCVTKSLISLLYFRLFVEESSTFSFKQSHMLIRVIILAMTVSFIPAIL